MEFGVKLEDQSWRIERKTGADVIKEKSRKSKQGIVKDERNEQKKDENKYNLEKVRKEQIRRAEHVQRICKEWGSEKSVVKQVNNLVYEI